MTIKVAAKATPEPLSIFTVSVGALTEYANNPRKNDAAVPDMVALLEKFGFRQPILVRGNQIVDGHLRIKAAKAMGMETVPAIDVGEMSEAEERALRLAMNKSVEWADWDNDMLMQEFEFIKDSGLDLGFTGFDNSEIDKVFKETMDNNLPKNTNADAGNPADPNYVSITFHMTAASRNKIKKKLQKIQDDGGLANLSQALIKALK